MSDFEPMMIPTRGASTSRSANSVSGSVWVVGVVLVWLLELIHWALHGPQRDVAAQLPARRR